MSSSVYGKTVQAGSGNDVDVVAFAAENAPGGVRRPARVEVSVAGMGINVDLDVTPRAAVEIANVLIAAVDRLSKSGDASATKALELAEAVAS